MLPLSLAVSFLLLLSSLSLQALALQGRSLQGVQQRRRHLEDQLLAAAQQLAGTLQQRHRCLLPLADDAWDPESRDPAAVAAPPPCVSAVELPALRQGQVGDQPWTLVRYTADPEQQRGELQVRLAAGGPAAAFALHWELHAPAGEADPTAAEPVATEPWLVRVQPLGLRGVRS